jgi:tetratricopeptide (TPR) repeat protein
MSSSAVSRRGHSPWPRVPAWRVSLFGSLALVMLGCSELEARRHVRVGNALFKAEQYDLALGEYDRADELAPGMYEVALNRGVACHQLIAKAPTSADRERAIECALAAFARLKQLRPGDLRADQLSAQTLFDARRFDALIRMYEARLAQNPRDRESVDALIGVCSRAHRRADALRWAIHRAQHHPGDAEAQYTVGLMIYNRLSQRRSANASYASGPDSNVDAPGQPAPSSEKRPASVKPGSSEDMRARLANVAARYMNRALAVRPSYREAMGFLALLGRREFDHQREDAEPEPLDEDFSEEQRLLEEELRLEPADYPRNEPTWPHPGDSPAVPGQGVPA